MIQDTICNTKEILFDSVSEQKSFQLDQTKIEDYRLQDDFNYTEYVAPDNWWTQFKNWMSQLWSKFISWVFGIEEVSGFWLELFKLLPYLLIIGVLFLLGWLFMKVNPSDILFEKQDPPQVRNAHLQRNPTAINKQCFNTKKLSISHSILLSVHTQKII